MTSLYKALLEDFRRLHAKGGPGSGNPNQPRDTRGRWVSGPLALIYKGIHDKALKNLATSTEISRRVYNLARTTGGLKQMDELVRYIIEKATIANLKKHALPLPTINGATIEDPGIPNWLTPALGPSDANKTERRHFDRVVNAVATIMDTNGVSDVLSVGELYTALYDRYFNRTQTPPSPEGTVGDWLGSLFVGGPITLPTTPDPAPTVTLDTKLSEADYSIWTKPIDPRVQSAP